jgi:DNA-directed RNA polymerase specialized sigma24 family protein
MNADVSQNKNKQIDFSYEPEATKLVKKIQDGDNVHKNKESLFKLILPFVSKVASYNLASLYNKDDAEDVVQKFILKFILNDNLTYRYDRSRNVPFCGYLKSVLRVFCANWERDYGEAKHRGPSLDDNCTNENGAGVQWCGSEISIQKSEQEEFQRDLEEIVRLLATNYLCYFNEVSSLDKEKTYGTPFRDGERVVNEQKLLAYYIRFINSEFLLSPKSRAYSVDRLRAFSYIRVNHSNDDCIKEIFGARMDFMTLLEDRIVSRNLSDVVFLSPEKEIRNTVDEWLRAPRMKDRIAEKYTRLKSDNIRLRKDYYYGIGA